MFKPCFVVRKEQESISNLLPWIFPHFNYELKRFVCFVAAENDKIIVLGSGTITTSGVITAAHIFSFAFQKATITLFVDDHHIATLPINGVSLDVYKDIALCNVDFPSYSHPCPFPVPKISMENKRLIAFGCPQGVFGQSWETKALGNNADFIVSRGVAIPGISGGGIYCKEKNEWLLLAVHSFAYLDSKTLYSRRLF